MKFSCSLKDRVDFDSLGCSVPKELPQEIYDLIHKHIKNYNIATVSFETADGTSWPLNNDEYRFDIKIKELKKGIVRYGMFRLAFAMAKNKYASEHIDKIKTITDSDTDDSYRWLLRDNMSNEDVNALLRENLQYYLSELRKITPSLDKMIIELS